MNNFYVEIERCIRHGSAYDLFWNMDGLKLDGYREIVSIREDGKVEIIKNGKSKILETARIPNRPEGEGPQLIVEAETSRSNAPCTVSVQAKVTEGTAPVYYTQGADKEGIYNNQYVLWELYGPNDEDYTDFWSERWIAPVAEREDGAETELRFKIEQPGHYRLRVSTVDLAGRSAVVWKEILIK